MTEPILYVALGCLCTALLVALVVPAYRRRTVRLTEKRVKDSIPLSLDEVEADKDRIRAEYAMTVRRLEQTLKAQQDRTAAQAVEIGRSGEALKALGAERDERDRIIAERQAQIEALGTEIAERDQRIARLDEDLGQARDLAQRRAGELDDLRGLLDEATLTASSRQVEIVARENDIEDLKREAEAVAAERAADAARLVEIEADRHALVEGLEGERKRASELETKVDRMFAGLADGEDLAARREADLAQLREALAAAARTESELNAKLGTVMAERSRLEVKLADSAQKLSRVQAEDGGEAPTNAVARLTADRRRLEERLTIVTRQNQKLRADLAARDGEAQTQPSGQDRAASAVLREQIAQIAAEMVHVVEVLEGSESPIRKAVPEATPGSRPDSDGTPSLADRIRALRAAAARP